MFAIEVTLLTGRYVATAHHDRSAHEWPPHPARLFSAMVATWADDDEPDQAERSALEWLEGLGAPSIAASHGDEIAVRKAVSHFVPVNDTSVVSGSQYVKRFGQVTDLLVERDHLLEESAGEVTKAVERTQDRLDKALDVESLVESAGKTNPRDAERLLPDGRGKQERHFPSVTPDSATVTYAWTADCEGPTTEALDGLLGRVARLGHSSSLVSCRLVDNPPVANLLPGKGAITLRCPQRGQLLALEREFQRHEGLRPRSLPFEAVRYGEVDPTEEEEAPLANSELAGELVVFEVPASSRRLPMTRALELTRALRGAVFHHAEDPTPEGLSGHQSDGTPSRDPHVAFLALPNAGHRYGDGRIMGLAVSLPDGLPSDAQAATYRAIGTWEAAEPKGQCRLTLEGGQALDLKRKQPPYELTTLRHQTWSRPSRRWVSITPIALPKNPGRLAQGSAAARAKAWASAEEQVRQSCLHADLPEPANVAVSLGPLTPGVRRAAEFPPFEQGARRGSAVRRRLVHAIVEFGAPVRGPVVLGSGRFLGLGLMRPLPEPKPEADSSGEQGIDDD